MASPQDIAASHPQPRTFAPSKEDVLQNLQYFFGAPVSPEKLKDYSEHHAMTYHFPDAYAGQNTKIRDTLNNLILKSPQNLQTSVGLPFFQITGTVVEWDECAAPRCRLHTTTTAWLNHSRLPPNACGAQGPLRCPPHAARAVRGRQPDADIAPPSPPRPRGSPRSGSDH